MRRVGDTVTIPGDYQHQARHSANPVQRFWHAGKQALIEQVLPIEPGDRALDVGCGSGVIAAFLASRGAAEVIAVDGNPSAIDFGRSHYAKQPNLRFVRGLVDEDFAGETRFDKVYCLELLEHIYWPQGVQLLQNIARVLRPGGRLLLTTPNYRSMWPLVEWLMDRLHLAPQMADDQHVEKFHRQKLARLVSQAGGLVSLRIDSHYFAAPWLALISEQLAQRVNTVETAIAHPFGCLLFALLEKAP